MGIKNWSFENVMIVAISGTVILLLFGWVGWLEDLTPVEEESIPIMFDSGEYQEIRWNEDKILMEDPTFINGGEIIIDESTSKEIWWEPGPGPFFLQLSDGSEINLTEILAQIAEVRDMYQTLLWMVAPAVEEISSYPGVRAIGSERILILPE